jgi:hypothetical protein
MDVKDAIMNECSYPLVYYTINDFDNEDLHLLISPGEYLCAELSITIPKVPSSEAYTRATQLVSEISIQDNSDPFPLPPNYFKITLFQGAVSFKALCDVYQQKGIAAANQMKSRWRKEGSSNISRTEYVLMRGPHGKGQCQGTFYFNQVAIQAPNLNLTYPSQPSSSVFGFIKDSIKSQLGGDSSETIAPPEKLDCSLTFINVPCRSIALDLLA